MASAGAIKASCSGIVFILSPAPKNCLLHFVIAAEYHRPSPRVRFPKAGMKRGMDIIAAIIPVTTKCHCHEFIREDSRGASI